MGDRKTFSITYFFFTFFILNLFSHVLNFQFKILPGGFSSIVTMPFRKVLYCIALLLIGWSSAQAKKLDVYELMRHCRRRDIAYVKEQVADFGNTTVVETKRWRGDNCLMQVVYWGHETCEQTCTKICYWDHCEETCENREECAGETLELVEYLLGIGSDVNVIFSDGDYSAIAVATQNRDIPLMKLLLENKADTEIADLGGKTPIFHAIRDTDYTGSTAPSRSTDGSSALSLLIEKGANINATDKYGQTALDLATKKGDKPAMELLQAAEKKQPGH